MLLPRSQRSQKSLGSKMPYKDLFLRKKSSWPRAALDLAAVEKGEIIPDSAVPKSDFLFLNYYSDHQFEFRDPKWRHENLSQQIGFINSFMNEAPQEVKVKIDKSRLLKFYQENWTKRKLNWKKIQLRILRKRTLKKTRNLINSETFR